LTVLAAAQQQPFDDSHASQQPEHSLSSALQPSMMPLYLATACVLPLCMYDGGGGSGNSGGGGGGGGGGGATPHEVFAIAEASEGEWNPESEHSQLGC
jgi:hypothetical protein